MSDLVVEVVKIESVSDHENADRLEVAVVGGWQVVVGKGNHRAGDLAIYVPPDAVVPKETAEKWGVVEYLGKGGRVKQIRLRGEASFGFLAPLDGEEKAGQDVASKYGITKYEPPIRGGGNKPRQGEARAELAGFPRYTNIQNLRHNVNVFEEGETVFIQEKIHGTNCRVGVVNGVKMAGSRQLRRDNPGYTWLEKLKIAVMTIFQASNKWKIVKRLIRRAWRFRKADRRRGQDAGVYWMPWNSVALCNMMNRLVASSARSVVVYGEVYGPSIQGEAMHYGKKDRDVGFAVFDIKVDGKYFDPLHMMAVCQMFGVETCPILGVAEFNMDVIKAAASGKSMVPGANHIREGVVVRPMEDSHDPKIGRKILKYVSDEYLLGNYDDYLEE